MSEKFIKRRAFSLVELLIALIVISIVIAAFVPTLTKKAKAPAVTVSNINPQAESVPVGAIILWYGENYPENWLPLDGQDISDEKYEKLREVMGLSTLPNLNAYQDLRLPVSFIVKACEKENAKQNLNKNKR